MAQLQNQPSINDVRGQAHLLLSGRLGQIDLSPLLVYRIASVPDSALLWLAWQFDVLNPLWQLLVGNNVLGGVSSYSDFDSVPDVDELSDWDSLTSSGGSIATQTAADQWRAIIQAAIPLKSVMGTPSALKQALATMGYPGATLLEGQSSWGGDVWPPDQAWAVFRVVINLAAGQGALTTQQQNAIVAVANFFKPARCWLDTLVLNFANVSDQLTPAPTDVGGIADVLTPAPSDAYSYTFPNVNENLATPPLYNALYQHAGVTYANQPVGVSDGASTLNGTPIEGNK